jgi:hypothetical protein
MSEMQKSHMEQTQRQVSDAANLCCFRWYVKPELGDCARPYTPGTCGGKWRLYPPKTRVGVERNIVNRIMEEGDRYNLFIEEIDILPSIPVH